MRKTAILVVLLLAASLALTACSGGSSTGPTPEQEAAANAVGQTITYLNETFAALSEVSGNMDETLPSFDDLPLDMTTLEYLASYLDFGLSYNIAQTEFYQTNRYKGKLMFNQGKGMLTVDVSGNDTIIETDTDAYCWFDNQEFFVGITDGTDAAMLVENFGQTQLDDILGIAKEKLDEYMEQVPVFSFPAITLPLPEARHLRKTNVEGKFKLSLTYIQNVCSQLLQNLFDGNVLSQDEFDTATADLEKFFDDFGVTCYVYMENDAVKQIEIELRGEDGGEYEGIVFVSNLAVDDRNIKTETRVYTDYDVLTMEEVCIISSDEYYQTFDRSAVAYATYEETKIETVTETHIKLLQGLIPVEAESNSYTVIDDEIVEENSTHFIYTLTETDDALLLDVKANGYLQGEETTDYEVTFVCVLDKHTGAIDLDFDAEITAGRMTTTVKIDTIESQEIVIPEQILALVQQPTE